MLSPHGTTFRSWHHMVQLSDLGIEKMKLLETPENYKIWIEAKWVRIHVSFTYTDPDPFVVCRAQSALP